MTIHKLEHVIVVVPQVGSKWEKLVGQELHYCYFNGSAWVPDEILLPSDLTYSHITRTLTEEECAREVVAVDWIAGKYVYEDFSDVTNCFDSALESVDSLLRSLSIPTDNLVFVHIDNMKK